jgi:deoxyribose-phosphate aldolase
MTHQAVSDQAVSDPAVSDPAVSDPDGRRPGGVPAGAAGAGRSATPAGAPDVARDNASLRHFLHGLPGVDQVGAEARAAALATRCIKKAAKVWALDTAIRMVDLTTLEGADTPGKVRSLAAKARRPDPTDPTCPAVAAVCVYPDLVQTAAQALAGSGVAVASVAAAFPAGRASLASKLVDVREAVGAGADEVDMVLDRGAFLSGRYLAAYEEIVAVRQACGGARLKVILETGELATLDNVRRASWLALLAGGDFVKTSTGKVFPAATPPVALVLLEAVRDFAAATGQRRGVKLAGGVRTAGDAVGYLVLAAEVAGEEWLDPALLRFGASSLLNDLLMQRSTERASAYPGPDDVTPG